MPTIFREGTSPQRKLLFHAYAYAVNSTEVGVVAATGIAVSVATEIDIDSVVRQGAIAASCYLVPAAPLYMYAKKMDRAIFVGKRIITNAPKMYKIAKDFTSPIEFFNYLASTGIRRFGVTEIMKNYCGVKSCDTFYWERENGLT